MDALLDGELTQEFVDSPGKAGTRVIVQQITPDAAAHIRLQRPALRAAADPER